MNKEPFDIPNILQSLAMEVNSGRLTIEEAAEELCRNHWTTYVDIQRTEHLLNQYLCTTALKGDSI
jgi:hypothetical protein